jgi:hypothetical protein
MTLRLLAEDAGDLQVISAAVQDAVAKVGDIRFDPRARTLTIACNRFRWEAGARRGGERVRSALQLGGVTAVRSRKLRLDAPAAVVSVLAVAWEPAAEPPGGVAVVTLAGGGELRAEMEALDAVLADVSDPWPARRAPAHD